MIARFVAWASPLRTGWLALGVALSLMTLAWLGYRAVAEWQHSAELLAQRSADTAVDVLVTAITRDMRAVQRSVLSSLPFDGPADPTLDLNTVGSAFARYPYPEAFFAIRGSRPASDMTFYARAERRPAWLSPREGATPFPVVSATEPTASRSLFDRIGRDAAHARRVVAFNATLHGTEYQVVALLSYEDRVRERLDAIRGFLVNLDWIRDHYFQELAGQVGRIQGAESGLTLSILDASRIALVGSADTDTDEPSSSLRFPLLFLDPDLVALDPPADLRRESWTAQATMSGDPALGAARLGARRTLVVATVSALVLALGFGLSIRAARANAALVAMRSDFVSAVTHELKTPIATIRAISETLAFGRSSTPEMSREYAGLAVQEAKRLTRLIDNLLAYARITDVTEIYSFEPLAMGTIVRQSLRDFDAQLATAGFDVAVDMPAALPLVRADRVAMVLAIDNVLDNAIRYSSSTRKLSITGHASNGRVVVDVADAGVGIPETEIRHVTRKFFRGSVGGSGLGLSIVQRIVADHAGTLTIQSEVGIGTTVSITLPSVRDDDDTQPTGEDS